MITSMGILDEKDAVILAEVAQSDVLPDDEREAILKEASPRAKRIGRVLIGSSKGSPAERHVADTFRKWARTNGMFVRGQKAARAACCACCGCSCYDMEDDDEDIP